ncbi:MULTISPECIES: restriction endonuclease subunit S [Pseudomonas]|jgi:type I restriction enzyme S subunit|uniref:restriction endonuclease subunit S n=1 Tax=Pseudomonas TaxID=286 RepID=UPI00398FB2DB
MAVKPGYKQTEVGVIPEAWVVCHLSDISTKITDGDHVTPNRTRHGYYLLSARNVLNGAIDVSDVDYVGDDEYFRMKRRCGPEAGDILISCSGTIGRVTVVPAGFECVLVRSAALVKLDRGKADAYYIQFWLQSNPAQVQIANSVNQGAQPNLFLNHIERLLCPRPPLQEQRAIAAALGDVDALLGALGRLIVKKRDLKQASMQQLLTGQIRLPGFQGEWEVIRLGSLGRFIKGTGVKKDEATAGDLPCVRYGEIYTRHHDVVRTFYSRITASVAAKATLLRTGDILFAGSGETKKEIGKAVAFVHECEAFAGGDIVILRPAAADAKFLGYILNSAPIQKQKASRGQGDAVVHISASSLAAIELRMPPLPEQTAIAAVLSDMDAELDALEQRLAKTRALKQGMMQELLTGRTRLL